MKIAKESARHFQQNFPGSKVYHASITRRENAALFMIRQGASQYLIIDGDAGFGFKGEKLEVSGRTYLKCLLTDENCRELRKQFPFTRPVLIGKSDSFGLGDRLGNAGPAHLKAIRKTKFRPVLAQQSIRELERTGRTAEEVLNAASCAAFREGYTDGFGADGDHLKTTADIDTMVHAGYTMFTIDPGEFVRNEAAGMTVDELLGELGSVPWREIHSEPDQFKDTWEKTEILLSDGTRLTPETREIYAGMVKYGAVIAHTKKMSDYIAKTYPDYPVELELSVDETDQTTTLFEHYLIASELKRLGVELVSLAPRFCGDFEKGVDFRGDLDQFRREYIGHLSISEKFGGYKLSIHSGSDKFSVYRQIGLVSGGAVHVKTAGTSYLEALRTLAEVRPELFLEILDFSMKRFETDRKSYQISGRPENITVPSPVEAGQIEALLDEDDTRQVLHVAYGSVLHGQGEISSRFKRELMEALSSHETLYEKNLESHFDKHLNPFSGDEQ